MYNHHKPFLESVRVVVEYYSATLRTFQPKARKIKKSLKKFFKFLRKKFFIIFWGMELSSPNLKNRNFYIPLKRSSPIFRDD